LRKFAYGNEAAEAVLVSLEYPALFPSEYEFVAPSEEALDACAAFPPNM
jgi:hypothetical protein